MTSVEIVSLDINDEMKNAYLDYAMSVIVSRALPDVRDGLKPVHRRVLFAMHEQGNVHNKPHKKSARIVGDVLGKYHPHSDTSVYDALVRLAQDFSMRYPLIDGQGNFGSIDGDSPAAMRYTEVRLAKISERMLDSLDEETVDFGPNYDNTEEQPLVLPSILPHLLVNGQTGIAVGMATNIPPHNLTEILDALIFLMDKRSATIQELMTFVKGPDFPTYGVICGMKGIYDAYTTGRGSVHIRGRATCEAGKNGKELIIVTELPYLVNKQDWIEKIADLVKHEELVGITDIRDESNKEGIRVVIDIKKGENAEVILNHLYKKTRLQDTFGVNMVCIVNGVPRLLNLKDCLDYFIEHRIEVIIRRTAFRLRKNQAKLHILDGLQVAVDHLDEVVEMIKKADSPDVAKQKLIETYTLSEIQAQAILDMKLSRITALERDKLAEERKAILLVIEDLKDILARPERVKEISREEFIELKKTHGDERRTEIVGDAKDVTIESLIAPADVFITYSHAGYIKRVELSEFRTQHRAGRGKTGAALKDNDIVKFTFQAHTHDHILMFSNLGKVYSFRVYELPEAAAQGKGKPISQLLALTAGEVITAMLPVKEFKSDHFIFMVTSHGVVKKTELDAFSNIRTVGLRAVTLDEGDGLISVMITNGECEVILATTQGKSIRFHESNVRSMGRSARGVTGISMDDGDAVVGAEVFEPNKTVLVVTELGYGKRSHIEEYRLQGRAGRGINSIKVTEKNGKVVGILAVSEDSQIMVTTDSGRVLRTPVSSLRIMGRVTQGLCLMRIMPGERVVSVSKPSEFDDTPVTVIESTEEEE